MKKGNFPEVVEKTESEIQEIIELINNSMWPDNIKKFVIKCIELALWFPLALEKKNISLRRLRTIIFGKGYSHNKQKSGGKPKKPETPLDAPSSESCMSSAEKLQGATKASLSASESALLPVNTARKPGHGRLPNTVYNDICEEINLQLIGLISGDDCPLACGGKLGDYKPGVLVRIKGQNFARVLRYTIEKLRCNLCGYIVEAQTPPDIGTEKYDASFKAILCIMKFFVAIPYYRQEALQKMLGFPLPDSTQWDLIEQLAGDCYPVFNVLKILAANGKLITNDDTSLVILEAVKAIKAGLSGERTGMYTTGIVAEHEEHQIALFLNGRQHSGENLSDILKLREESKEPIIQMCDALRANIAKGVQTILCNCLSHGFRKFEELVDYFEEECIFIMSMISNVYDHEALTVGLNAEERLQYHQAHSAPILDELWQYMTNLLLAKRVEPNSALGGAIKYMQTHWSKLTRFLSVAGAPLDSNVVERALKVAIRNRKSAMFYRTQYSASIGGMLTSLIYTCHLAQKNPHAYLIALQHHRKEVAANPRAWLPWNYEERLYQHKAAA